MNKFQPNEGIPRHILLIMAVLSGFTVANLYYNQPLLEMICGSVGITQVQANLITVITQMGYALGLLFVIPLADMIPVRRITICAMVLASASAFLIAVSDNVWLLWGGSLFLGLCSIMPQLFVPMATLFSEPENKSRNMGYVVTGLMMGIISARFISGYIGSWFGWRAMFYIAGGLMLMGLVITLIFIPQVTVSFKGTYCELMKTVGHIFISQPRIRFYSFRSAMGFGSLLPIWACLAFHLAGEPFHAGSNMVGLLSLFGIVGAMAASGVGKLVPTVGIRRMSVIGSCSQVMAWVVAFLFRDSYAGLVTAIILVDVGSQCLQVSNQGGSLRLLPEATNRVNTIFMTTFFVTGSISTLFSGISWSHFGWDGVCAVGFLFGLGPLIMSAFRE
jgi:predicted MFS family arabinose efflux permease